MLRRSAQLIVTSVGVGAWVGYVYLPNTAGLDVYETMLRSKSMFHSNYVNTLIKEVVKDVNPHIPKVDVLKHCKFFPAISHDAFSRGSITSKAVIGYPEHIACRSAPEIMSNCVVHIPLTGTVVKWNSAPGMLICKSFLLTENSKKFIIARELFKLDANYLRYKAILGGSFFVCWSMSTLFVRKVILTANVIKKLLQKWNNFLVLLSGPMETRQTKKQIRNQFIGINLSIQFVIACVCVLIYLNRINKRKRDIDTTANEKVAKLGRNYVTGGAEWCDLTLMRYMALQATLDPSAKKYLNEEGVRKPGLLRLVLIGQNYVPISTQRSFFREQALLPKQDILDELLEGKEAH